MTGVVKNILGNKGYGFILADMTRIEYFFHRDDFIGHWDDLVSDTENEVGVKIPMEFAIVDSPRGPRAANVRRLDYPNQAV